MRFEVYNLNTGEAVDPRKDSYFIGDGVVIDLDGKIIIYEDGKLQAYADDKIYGVRCKLNAD